MNLDINRLSKEEVWKRQLSFREGWVHNCLDISKWKKLSSKIDEFNPDVIVLIADKMPRVYQALNLIDSNFFKAELVVSSFALDYLPNKDLDDKKIAIVDGCLNVGTTFKNTEAKINHLFSNTETKFFAAYQSENTHIVDVLLADDGLLTIEKYEGISNCLASSIISLPRPIEIDFPIFTCDIPEDFYYKQFAADLTKPNSFLHATRLDLKFPGNSTYAIKPRSAQNRTKK